MNACPPTTATAATDDRDLWARTDERCAADVALACAGVHDGDVGHLRAVDGGGR